MINPTHIDEQVTLSRDVEVITIPFGTKTKLKKGEFIYSIKIPLASPSIQRSISCGTSY